MFCNARPDPPREDAAPAEPDEPDELLRAFGEAAFAQLEFATPVPPAERPYETVRGDGREETLV